MNSEQVIREDAQQNGEKDVSILTGEPVAELERRIGRIKPDPSLQEQPTFVDTRQPSSVRSRKTPSLALNTGRVQHEDPFLNTLSCMQMKDAEVKVVGANWWNQSRSGVDYSPKPPKVSDRAARSFDEAEECSAGPMCDEGTATSLADNENKNPNPSVKTTKERRRGSKSRFMSDSAISPDAFDICALDTANSGGNHLKLAPSLLDQRRNERKQNLGRSIPQTESVHVIAPGIVFLRSWLTIGEQVRFGADERP